MEFQSLIKRTRRQKILALAGKFAINIAKEKHDPQFKKYHEFRKKFILLRRTLFVKYKREAIKRANLAIKKTALNSLGSNK